MRLLFVTHRYPPHTGGVETHVRQIATRLADRGHEVGVFSADAGPAVSSSEVDDGVRIQRFRSVSPSESFYIAPQMRSAIRRFGADVVHAHNYHAVPMLIAALAVSDERFVVTTHYHGGSASHFRDRLLKIYRVPGKWALEQADEVIAVSEWEREQLYSDFGTETTVIPNGLDVDRFSAAEAEQRQKPYLLCVGRLEKYKGIQHIIRALPMLPGYTLVVAGCGPYRRELERIARRTEVTGRVEFLGHADDQRLPGLYAGAEVYVTLSEFEAYGMTVAESIAAGTPCVVRDTNALSEWARVDGCVSVDGLDPQRSADAIESAAGSEVSAPIPTWDEVTDRISTTYNPGEAEH